MFYYIRGELALLDSQTAVIDVSGVGYKLLISGTTCGALAGKQGKEVKLFTHLAIREDAWDLYGFATDEELTAFRMLISVSGIGAKSAVAILSLYTPEKLCLAIVNGDSKAIARAPGIGAKTAARIVLELKDKIAKELTPADGEDVSDAPTPSGDSYGEALNALLVLGYTRSEAASALRGAPAGDVESLIKYALSKSNILK